MCGGAGTGGWTTAGGAGGGGTTAGAAGGTVAGTTAGGAAGGATGVAVGAGDGVLGAGVVLAGGLAGAGAAGCPPKQPPSKRLAPSTATASTGRGIFMVTVLKKGPCGAPGFATKDDAGDPLGSRPAVHPGIAGSCVSPARAPQLPVAGHRRLAPPGRGTNGFAAQ